MIGGLGWSVLMHHKSKSGFDRVSRLLQDSRVRASLDVQNNSGATALHLCCGFMYNGTSTTYRFLQAGANPSIKDKRGLTPLAYLEREHPERSWSIAHLKLAPDADKASFLIKARLIFVAAASTATPPFCLQNRVTRGLPLPRVVPVEPPVGGKGGRRGRR